MAFKEGQRRIISVSVSKFEQHICSRERVGIALRRSNFEVKKSCRLSTHSASEHKNERLETSSQKTTKDEGSSNWSETHYFGSKSCRGVSVRLGQ